MERRILVYYLQDIIRAIDAIDRFVTDVDFESFATNEEKATAVTKKIEIIGEAVKKIPESSRNQYPEIPWKAIAGMRDLLVHVYWNTDLNLVWQVIQEDLPPLKQVVSQLIIQQEQQ
jgi:uncharacterized protein with HEPN domain